MGGGRRGGPTITADSLPQPDKPSVWEAPEPVLLNTFKHHAAALRQRIREAAAAGPAGLEALAGRLVVIGTDLMDLYLGELAPARIGELILDWLRAEGFLELSAYRDWIQSGGGYRALTLGEDGSRWVLRLGDAAGRYVHGHPARRAPLTCRVRANVLKTAVMALAYCGVHGGDPADLELVNVVRSRYLGLSRIGRDLSGAQGLGAVIARLARLDTG
jgi:hypothetical protein